uniref:Uncharacterized protein n=1 Tax=Anguilla anguilla TaxID=7936 RepID=A0A0E9UAC1_ANGAN
MHVLVAVDYECGEASRNSQLGANYHKTSVPLQNQGVILRP